MSPRSVRLSLIGLLIGIFAIARADEPQWKEEGKPPPEEDYGRLGPQPLGTEDLLALKKRWDGVGRLKLDEQSWWAEGGVLEDGVCKAKLEKGIIIPITSGSPEVGERKVGLVFVGSGSLELSFPERAGALTFANHMVMNAGQDKAALAPVARQAEPFRTPITRAVLFSADRVIEGMLKGLDPVGGGMVERATQDGVDAEYVVTSSDGEIKARAIARDLLPERRLELLRSGLDPVEMLRFDRMMHEEVGQPGSYLRLIGDFRTGHRYRVAAGTGPQVGGKADDSWLTCYRDGADHRDSGYRSLAFAHGTDAGGGRHLVRFSGEPFPSAEPYTPGLPPTRVEAVRGHAELEIKAGRGTNTLKAQVKSRLALRAREKGARFAVMRLPRHEALEGTWAIDRISLPDGSPLGWLEVESGLPQGIDARAPGAILSGGGQSNSRNASTSSSSGGGGIGSTPFATSVDPDSTSPPSMTDQMANLSAPLAEVIKQRMERRQEILVVFPRPLDYGEEIEILLDWQAVWPFSNYAIVPNAEGGYSSQALTAGTGPRSLLPELLPMMGGTPWDFTARVTVPPRRLDVAVTGWTTNEWVDDGGWEWTETRARAARRPAVAIGRWKAQVDPPAFGLPAVRTHLAGADAAYLQQFGPEIRRIFVFLRRFVPMPDTEEIDVYEGRATVPHEAQAMPVEVGPAGLVGIQKVAASSVTGPSSAGAIRSENPHYTQTIVARQIASQVWAQSMSPASSRDSWIATGLSDAYAAYYIRAALKEEGFDSVETRLESVLKDLEKVRLSGGDDTILSDRRYFLSLTDGGSRAEQLPQIYSDYTFFVLTRMLRERLGDHHYFRSLDRFARQNRGERVTTTTLLESLELSTGKQLGDFFDFWIRGGFIPSVELDWAVEDQADGRKAVVGCLRSDIPFGTFDVPVRVIDREGQRKVSALVDIVDGVGQFALSDREGEALEALVDPDRQLVAYSRKSQKVQKLRCP